VKTLIVAACVLVACSSSPLESAPVGGGANGGSAGAPPAASGGDTAFVNSCSAARAQLLGAIETVSTGNVQVLSDTSGIKTLYVDATAGGQNGVTTHPWTFIALGDATKAALNDLTSLESLAWDLAFKRVLIYTNGGEGGPGSGASVFLDKDFANVTSADLTGADFVNENFFDDDCNPIVDITGAASTSFSAWYNYDEDTHVVTPATGTWLVRGATGKFFKLRFKSYYATPSGGVGSAGGAYLLEIGAL
jgi:HmuY protein